LVIAAVALAALALVAACAQPEPVAAPTSSPTVTATPSATPSPTPTVPARRVFPIIGEASYGHTHHGYPATDILADCGLPYVAPYSGTIDEVNRVDHYDLQTNAGPTRGGLSVSLIGDDGVRYYGSHFSSISENIQPGTRVSAGDPIAIVGRTGDAGACHVHFGLSPACGAGDWYVRRGVIWPWPYLDSWRGDGNADPSLEIQQWLATNGCPDQPFVEP
jgi:murein DD-endopeptidase MepM/ murein hydrolase activator NlpD